MVCFFNDICIVMQTILKMSRFSFDSNIYVSVCYCRKVMLKTFDSILGFFFLVSVNVIGHLFDTCVPLL